MKKHVEVHILHCVELGMRKGGIFFTPSLCSAVVCLQGMADLGAMRNNALQTGTGLTMGASARAELRLLKVILRTVALSLERWGADSQTEIVT